MPASCFLGISRACTVFPQPGEPKSHVWFRWNPGAPFAHPSTPTKSLVHIQAWHHSSKSGQSPWNLGSVRMCHLQASTSDFPFFSTKLIFPQNAHPISTPVCLNPSPPPKSPPESPPQIPPPQIPPPQPLNPPTPTPHHFAVSVFFPPFFLVFFSSFSSVQPTTPPTEDENSEAQGHG